MSTLKPPLPVPAGVMCSHVNSTWCTGRSAVFRPSIPTNSATPTQNDAAASTHAR